MTEPATPLRVPVPPHSKVPYAISWIDQLIAWIDRLPGPSWGFYAAALALFACLNNAVFWIDGSQTAGSFDPVKTADSFIIVFFVALYHHLRVVAKQSFAVFQSVLNVPEDDLHGLDFRVAHLPRQIGWLTVIIGVAISVANIQSDPVSFGLDKTLTFLPVIYQYAVLILSVMAMSALVAQTIRQLRLVNTLHRQASAIDIFQLAPVHAFARFTARAGTGLLLFVAFNSLYWILTNSGAPLAVVIVLSVLSASVFVIPLLGMRKRLHDEIQRHLRATNEAIKVTISRIHDQVDSDSVDRIAGLNTTLTALFAERTFVKSISPWPWGGSTLTGFISTLLVPVVLWLVTRLLARLL